MKEIDDLLRTMRLLRDPVDGCPWDREQTMHSILPYTLEEAYELADAIERNEKEEVMGELGDLLFHICFYAQIACEKGDFDFCEVARNLNYKLQDRHPHVFTGNRLDSAREQADNWEQIKLAERRRRDARSSLLDEINPAQPAVSRAYTLQKRAATVGFDWSGPEPVFEKIEEEIRELKQEMQTSRDPVKIRNELGDVLFACINLARHAGVNPESALRSTNRKFESRFRYIEQNLAMRGTELEAVSSDEMEKLWEEAKQFVD